MIWQHYILTNDRWTGIPLSTSMGDCFTANIHIKYTKTSYLSRINIFSEKIYSKPKLSFIKSIIFKFVVGIFPCSVPACVCIIYFLFLCCFEWVPLHKIYGKVYMWNLYCLEAKCSLKLFQVIFFNFYHVFIIFSVDLPFVSFF